MEAAKTTVFLDTMFRVNVSVNVDRIGLISYELRLCYSNRLLKGVNVELPEGHFLTPEDPGNIFVAALGVNQTGGYAYAAVTLTAWSSTRDVEKGKVGNGTLITVTFRAEEIGSSNLTVRDYIFLREMDLPGDLGSTVLGGLVEVVLPDFNNDGKVDISDLAIISMAFGSTPGHGRWNPAWDVNKDSKINILDMVITAKYFGMTVAK